jgi:hypothetical protein
MAFLLGHLTGLKRKAPSQKENSFLRKELETIKIK